jgi:uncharacterized protein (PEP-CTERM system associated)
MATTTSRPAPLAALAAALAVACCWPAAAADWRITPTLRLRQAYSDNMALSPPAQARAEFSSEIAPGVAVQARGPRLTLALDYALQRLAYSRSPSRLKHQLDAAGHAEALADWLYVDGRASVSQQNISAFGPQRSDPAQLGGNTSTVRSAALSPYLKHHFRGLAEAELRYTYQASSSGALLRAHSRLAGLRLVGDNRAGGWNWEAAVDQRQDNDAALAQVNRRDATLTLRVPLRPRLSWFASAGRESSDYQARAGAPGGRHWSSGLSWTPSPRSSVAASVGRRYFGDTYSLDARHQMRHLVLTLGYSEDITSSQQELQRLPPSDLGNFLYQLWAGRIPDPLLRIQVINAFLRYSQLQGPNAGNVNYLSHNYFLQKQWNLSALYSTPKSTLALGLADSRRSAQTSSAIDSPLLGPAELAQQEHTRQTSLHAGWTWRMSARNNLSANASYAVATAPDIGRRDRSGTLALGLSRQLRPKLSASVDLRHSWHASSAGGGYRENGAAATLSVLF